MRRLCAVLVLGLVACATAIHQRPAPQLLFVFRNDMWMNLHHFLRAAGRGMPVRGPLTESERTTWNAAVAYYAAHISNRDLGFDDGLVAIKAKLRNVDESHSVRGIGLDPELERALDDAAPIYRKYFWPAQQHANQEWIDGVQPLVAKYGRAIAPRVAAGFEETWPSSPIPVDLSAAAGPNDAYTTAPPTHTTISPAYQGFAALEILFHEPSHAWGRKLQRSISRAAEAQGKKVPGALWHAVLFYNAGESTRRALAADGIAYVEMATSHNIYRDLCGDGCRDRVVAAWTPHLDGTQSMDAAVDALVHSWPQ